MRTYSTTKITQTKHTQNKKNKYHKQKQEPINIKTYKQHNNKHYTKQPNHQTIKYTNKTT